MCSISDLVDLDSVWVLKDEQFAFSFDEAGNGMNGLSIPARLMWDLPK